MKYENKQRIRKFLYMLFLLSFFPALQAQEKLSLENAVGIALKNNFDIVVANNSASISKVNNTRGNAGMLPTVALIGSGNYSLNNRYQKNTDGTSVNTTSLNTTSLSAGAELSWTLFDGGKMFVTKSKLNEIQALGEIQYREKVLQTMFNVIAAYYDVV